ncbi:hypothetical protein MNBD_GAMMA17-82 [hydrothermal vent metagenome]|uniref:Uncharacterized protein n=1 Tax=hydrothermal vent metagenome TaxID=652676 RepID=A0A3B0ZLW6_9ZZZZ
MAREMASRRRLHLFASIAMLCPLAAPLAAPVNLSGEVGYAYRLMKADQSETISHQMRGAIRGNSYLWQPWMATVNANLRLTQDKTDYNKWPGGVAGISGSTTTLTTGELNLNVIPQSRFPLSISYQVNDSRVDTMNTVTSPLTAAGSREFSTKRFSLRQNITAGKSSRFKWNLDSNQWDSSNSEKYSDWLLGGSADFGFNDHRLQLRGSYKSIDRAALSQESSNTTLSGDHFYHSPTRALRVDSSVDYYQYQTEGVESNIVFSNGELDTSSYQASSFVFWRPVDRKLSASAGVRLFNLTSDAISTNTADTVIENETELLSLNATAGGLYQYTKNIRFDGNMNFSVNDNGTEENNAYLGRLGALLQSDIHEIPLGMMYQWSASASAQMQGTDRNRDFNTMNINLGHDANRSWLNDDKSSALRFGWSQGVNASLESGDEDANSQRFDHSVNVGWDRYGARDSTYSQLTISDARTFGDRESDQQLVNLQLSRTQNISRRSVLTGNITAQSVRQNFAGQDESEVSTTTTGSINYQLSSLFGIPRFRYGFDVRVSRASRDSGVDRAEWENRLDYSVGLVDTRASWRLIDAGEQDYTLVYFQVTRRF